MHVAMIKKKLASGEPCKKCQQAEDLLKTRKLWSRVDEIIWAVENEGDSPGMRLAEQHGIESAPSFIVTRDDGQTRAYDSVLTLIREELQQAPPSVGAAAAPTDLAGAAADHADRPPHEIVRWGLERFGADCAIA